MTYKIENISKVPLSIRPHFNYQIERFNDLMISNGMKGSFVQSFFYDCINGQIIISTMPRKSKERYYNPLSDFYIDTRTGFRGRKELDNILDSLNEIFYGFTKFSKPKFSVGDWVIVKKDTNNKGLISDYSNLNLGGKRAKIVKLSPRSISNPKYEGFYIRIDGRGNHIHASSYDVNISKIQKKV